MFLCFGSVSLFSRCTTTAATAATAATATRRSSNGSLGHNPDYRPPCWSGSFYRWLRSLFTRCVDQLL
uniref:Putative secreted peptide n=1 Tax=Anopheles braziliensis TaxID=58242 RepID=A0A2M3ZW58_9DIPT